MERRKKLIIIFSILVLMLLIGASYAFFTYTRVGDNSHEIVMGQIYLHFKDGKDTVDLTNIFPETEEEAIAKDNNYITFTINGVNTTNNKNIRYEILLSPAEGVGNRVRVDDKYLRFALTEIVDGNETVLFSNKSYDEINNTKIYENLISSNTTEEVNITYQLRMWLSDEVLISDTDPNADFTVDEFKNIYGSVKVYVSGKTVKPTFAQTLAAKTGTDGIVAIDSNGDLANGGDIREYRYSGSGKYCTYTDATDTSITYQLNVDTNSCPQACVIPDTLILNNSSEITLLGVDCVSYGGSLLNANETIPNEGVVNNYVSFNGELWRIIGVFNDENADGVKAQRVKIIKDNPLTNNLYTSTDYTYNGTSYALKNSYTLGYGYYHWNSTNAFGQTRVNDWTKAGLQYYLNDEVNPNSYYNSISSNYQEMVESMKYYLGNVADVVWNQPWVASSPSGLYDEERNIASSNVHAGNSGTWNGKIGLMYPSDYGYSVPSAIWSDSNLGWPGQYWLLDNGSAQYSWMNDNTSIMEWTMTPADYMDEYVIIFGLMGYLGSNLEDMLPGAGLSGDVTNAHAVSPVLYLKSNVITTKGDGTELNPYQIELQK